MKLAEKLAETIIQEISEDTHLARCESFSDLHDFTDANLLGDSESYFGLYGVEVVQEAQDLVDRQLPIEWKCRACGGYGCSCPN